MLSQEHIPIGKLKQAYGLNEQEVLSLLSALPPEGVFPAYLWRRAYETCWFVALQEFTRSCDINPSLFQDKYAYFLFLEQHAHAFDMYYITTYREKIYGLLVGVSMILSPDKIKSGLDYILKCAYETCDSILEKEIDNFLEKLEIEYNNFAARLESCRGEKQFIEFYNGKSCVVSINYFSFISQIFCDTIVVDKVAAIRYLFKHNYPLRHEVKGITRELVESIRAIPVAPTNEETSATPSTPSIVVPRDLWAGKSYPVVRNGIQREGYPPEVIAYVLFEWCKLKNKTEIGRLLGPGDQTDSSCLRRGNRLLKKATDLNITTA